MRRTRRRIPPTTLCAELDARHHPRRPCLHASHPLPQAATTNTPHDPHPATIHAVLACTPAIRFRKRPQPTPHTTCPRPHPRSICLHASHPHPRAATTNPPHDPHPATPRRIRLHANHPLRRAATTGVTHHPHRLHPRPICLHAGHPHVTRPPAEPAGCGVRGRAARRPCDAGATRGSRRRWGPTR